MFTRHAIAVAVLVAATAAAAQPAPSPATATPPKPVAKPAAAAPSQPAPSKPAVAAPAPAASVQPTPAVSAQPATVALVAPLPRQKPKWPPSPRSKPEAPVEVASAPTTAPATPALAAPAATQPIAANGQEALAACGNACSEILFKTVDNCLWVQSANPRPITFSAEVGGRPVALKLEGADPNKADAHTAALKGAPAKDESAYHTRLHDPFVSVAPGIPAYRARLGPPATCVKSRNEIQKFTATFAG